MNAIPETFKAAVVREKGGVFQIENIKLKELRDDEVVVRIVATGMCHTDMVARDQIFPVPQPVVLGHEGAGVVEAVGAAVTKLVPGDHVVLSLMFCGKCEPCLTGHLASCIHATEYCFAAQRIDGTHAICDEHGGLLHDQFFSQSSFATYAVANERNAIKVRKDAPLELLGPLGCGIQTGAGAVLNVLKVGAGDSFAVFGAGAVGLSALLAAKLAGATTIIAVDIVPSRLELAKELGATHVINGSKEDAVAAIRKITDGGVKYSLDTTAVPALVRSAVDVLRVRGVCGFVGASKPGSVMELDLNDVMIQCKTVTGIIEGDSIPDLFIPQLVDLFMQGKFAFDKLIKFYDFDQINQAAEDSEKGITLKPVIRIGKSA